MEQPDLFEGLPAAVVSAFRRHHEENPHVYAKLREYALQARGAGRTRLGIAVIFERLRWHAAIETTDEEYKLNNNHRAYYARLLMANEPDLRGMFELRTSRADAEITPEETTEREEV